MLNTMSKYKELERILVEKIDEATSDNVKVITANEYGEDRDSFMVVVGVNDVAVANPLLPDYQYTLDILVDCFINEDKAGSVYETTVQQISDLLQPYLRDPNLLSDLFGDFPICGMFMSRMTNMTTEESNQTTISLQLFASFDRD